MSRPLPITEDEARLLREAGWTSYQADGVTWWERPGQTHGRPFTGREALRKLRGRRGGIGGRGEGGG